MDKSVGTLYSGQLNSIYSMQLNACEVTLWIDFHGRGLKTRLNSVGSTEVWNASIQLHGIDTIQLS